MIDIRGDSKPDCILRYLLMKIENKLIFALIVFISIFMAKWELFRQGVPLQAFGMNEWDLIDIRFIDEYLFIIFYHNLKLLYFHVLF